METTVAELTVTQFKQLVADVFDEKLAELKDPDYGLELRDDVVERLQRQSEAVKQGDRGIGLDELLKKLNIDRAEIEVEKDVPVAVS